MQTIYIDAFAGGALGSVLTKHYLDLSLTKLKQAYEQAMLQISESDLPKQVVRVETQTALLPFQRL